MQRTRLRDPFLLAATFADSLVQGPLKELHNVSQCYGLQAFPRIPSED